MRSFATDRDRLAFLLETEAVHSFESLQTQAEDEKDSEPDENKGPATKSPESKDRPKYVTNYIGSKQKLVDWIWRNTPQSLSSAIDAFSGSAVVAYMYKSKGLQVSANDRMWLNYHTARAIVENRSDTVADDELEALLTDNPKAGTFVQDNFGDLYYAKGVHAIIDTIRTNINQLEGYKKDIALFALGRACLLGKGGFAHFNSTVQNKDLQDSPDQFKDRYRKIVRRINELVFDNGKDNKAYREEIGDFLPQVKADVAYFDPPYATEFSSTNYENTYHFVEGLMTYWNGLTLDESSKRKIFQSDHKTVTKGNANEFFSSFLDQAKHIPHWLISYRDHAFPTEGEIKKIVAAHGRNSRMKSHDHQYLRSPNRGEASQAKERLFVCKVNQEAPDQGVKQENKQATKAMEPKEAVLEIKAPNIHTSIPIVLNGLEQGKLSTEALEQIPQGSDPQFTFVLCRVGTNKNGDHFTSEELSTRYMTVLNKKIDLKHSQDFTDIVGGIIAANFVEEDSSDGYIECVGELYVTDSPHARLAYKLIKKLVVSQVSMECDYEEGECSICGKRVNSKEEYCVHLNKFKGREYQGKPVFEILHGVTFTGLGLLDRKGADDNARITKVGSEPVERGDNKPDPKNENESENTAHQSAAADKSKVNKQGELSMADIVTEAV